MTKRTRLFLLGSAAILGIGLGTGLVASFMGFQPLGFAGREGPDELAYVPADTQLVAYADVRRVVDSDLRRRFRQFDDAGGAARFRDDTGIDIERDIDHVVASLSEAELDHGRPLLLVRGRFDERRIEGVARRQGGTFEQYRDRRLVTHPAANIGIAFAEPGLVALGSPGSVRRALDVRAGEAAGIRSNGELMRQVRAIGAGHAWVVVRADAVPGFGPGRGGLPPGLQAPLPPLVGVTWLAARGHVNGGLRGTVQAEAATEATAQDLRDAIRGFVALGRLQAGQAPELLEFLESLELGGQGRTVSLGFVVPLDVLDTFHGRRLPGALMPPASPRPQGRPQPRERARREGMVRAVNLYGAPLP